MLNYYNTNIEGIAENYKPIVLDKIASIEYSIGEENELHTKNIANCSRGDQKAKEYVLQCIKKILTGIVTDNDKEVVFETVKKEFSSFIDKQYEKFINTNDIYQEQRLSYYQLLEKGLSAKQHATLKELESQISNGDKELSLIVLAYEIYKSEYGLDKIDDIKEMELNNIEVHDIKKIRVECVDGNWYTIDNYNFKDNETIRTIAKRLLNQNSGGDLTEDRCERQTMLADGSRITVTLKPASADDNIFIKKFDSFKPTVEGMIANGTVTAEMVDDLRVMAKTRWNIVIIGGVNSGKSGLLKMYAGLIPVRYKIGMIDPTRDTNLGELYPDKDIVTLYETGEYSLNDQFSYLLTTNRNIIGISESKSFEVEQSLKGMLRGNSGSFLTLHTDKPEDVVDNICWMCLENGIQQDMRVLRTRVASAVDGILRTRQFPNGTRKVDGLWELVATGDFEHPFKIVKKWSWDNKQQKVVRIKAYKPSESILDKMRYYNCSEKDIEKFVDKAVYAELQNSYVGEE